MRGAEPRLSIKGRSPLAVLLIPLCVLIAVIGGIVLVTDVADSTPRLDADLCPVNPQEIAGSATFLFDFRKPLDADRAALPGDLLRQVALRLPGNTELQVFTLAPSATSPRTLLQRLCKPYENADMQVETAKDQRGGVRDCDDPPAQLPDSVRESAARFCLLRDRLQQRLGALSTPSRSPDQPIEDAYLVEAIEDSWLDFERRPRPHVLYLFSDMLQHAPWYSHLDLPWSDWRYDDFAALLGLQRWSFERQSLGAGLRVEVFYVPRIARTDQPRPQRLHQEFWREHFPHAEVVFHAQAPMRGYAARPLMNVLTEAQEAAREREELERLLRQVRAEQALLEQEQEELRRQAEAGRLQRETEKRYPPPAAEPLAAEREADDPEPASPIAHSESGTQPSPTPQDEPGDVPPAATSTPADPPSTPATASASDPATTPTTSDTPEPPVPPPVEPAPEPCALRLADGAEQQPEYPQAGRADLGDALIVVRYAIDDAGETPDDRVTVVLDASEIEREALFDRFARVALETVRDWTFVFDDPADASCTREQVRTIGFQFTHP